MTLWTIACQAPRSVGILQARILAEVAMPSSRLLSLSGKTYEWLCRKEASCYTGDSGDVVSTPDWGRSPGEGHDNPFRYSCLENPQEQWRLMGYNPWGRKESDMTK